MKPKLKTALATDDEENLRKLQKGRVDLVLTDKIVGRYIINTKIPGAASELDWLDPPVSTEIQYIVFFEEIPRPRGDLIRFQ